MKLLKLAAAAALAFSAAAATAKPGDVAVGATVFGPQGEAVGTVETVADGIVTVNTGKHMAPLPANVFGAGETGPTITVTKAQLDGMIDEQLAAAAAKRDAALVEGAAVSSADNQPAGSITSVDGDNVVLESAAGPVALKRDQFAMNANGMLLALFTKDQIETAAASVKAAQ